MTADEVLDRASRLISDPKRTRFTKAVMLVELNNILAEVSSRTEAFKKSADIQIQDERRVYEFPVDMIQLKQMTIEHIVGELVFSTTYETIINSTNLFSQPTSNAILFHAFGQRELRNRTRIFFRDLVSDHEFIFDPALTADTITPDTDTSTELFGT